MWYEAQKVESRHERIALQKSAYDKNWEKIPSSSEAVALRKLLFSIQTIYQEGISIKMTR